MEEGSTCQFTSGGGTIHRPDQVCWDQCKWGGEEGG